MTEELIRHTIIGEGSDYIRRGINLARFFPKIVVLCGSTKFVDQFNNWNRELTLRGYIVLSVGCHVHSDQELLVTESQKQALDVLHKRKIDLADEVCVLNVGGYIGTSTASEVAYARSKGKRVHWLVTESLMEECGSGGCGTQQKPLLTDESLLKLAAATDQILKEQAL